ncbi:MAG: TolB family protein [Pyrinomonadaceae bacterium]
MSTEGGTPVLITDKHLYSHTLSPDGKLIAYYHRPPELNSSLQIEVIPIGGGPPVKTFTSVGDGSRVRWAPDGTSLDYIETREGVANLWRLPINGGEPKQLTDWTADLIFWFAWWESAGHSAGGVYERSGANRRSGCF